MGYREIIMVEVNEVLRRWQAGHAVRRAARECGCDRKTLRRYDATAAMLALPRDRPLTDEQVHAVATRVQAKPVAVVGDDYRRLEAERTRLVAWLGGERPLRLQKVHTLLQRQGVDVPYYTLRRFAIAELGWRRVAPTVRLDDAAPGQEAQLDFARMGMVVEEAGGKARALWVLIVTLVMSRHMFVYATFTQTTAAVCEGLEAAWRFFGGMPHVLIPDNTRAMIDVADPLTPRLVEAFGDYVQARGLFVDPARVRRPKDKARVERQVQYVRDNWFAGETFAGLLDARASAIAWSRDVAARRTHGTTRAVPLDVYERDERGHMRPPPDEPFDVPTWTAVRVQRDHHVQAARALYSVPTAFVGRPVRVRADRRLVRIDAGTDLIAVHERQAAGGRSTKAEHDPVWKEAYALRNAESLVAKARACGEHVGRYAERLLGGPLPWTRMRQAYALVRLCDTYGPGRVEAVCQSALAFDVLDVARVRAALEAATARLADAPPGAKVVALPLPAPRFARPEQPFATRGPAKGPHA